MPILTPPFLSGEFVNLRPLDAGDAEQTLRWRQSERAINLNQGAGSLESQKAWIASRPASEFNFIIESKDGAALGMLSLVDVDHHHAGRCPTGCA